eukprot:478898_1
MLYLARLQQNDIFAVIQVLIHNPSIRIHIIMSIINQLKKEKRDRTMRIKRRRRKRKENMKQNQLKKQNKLKKRGIHSRTKNVHATWTEKANNGEIDISRNAIAMLLLLTENGCKQFGSFFREFEDCSNKMDDDLWDQLSGKEPDEMIELNDRQINALKNSSKLMEFMLKYGTNAPCDDPNKWNNRKIDAFLRNNNITPHPKPSRDILIQVVVELIDMKHHMMDAVVHMSSDDESQHLNGHHNYVLDAQPIPPDPLALKDWPSSAETVGSVFSTMRGKSMFFRELTTKPFKDLQESLVVIARNIDKYDCIQKVPLFIAQDSAQTQALSISVIALKETETRGLPLIVVKYFVGKRSSGMAGIKHMMAEVEKGRLMQEIGCDLEEVQLMTRLFQKNRKVILNDVVNKTETKWRKGWRLSAFMPYRKGEKKCPSCGQLGTVRCARCKKVGYCSRVCQKKDWKYHKKVCNKKREIQGEIPLYVKYVWRVIFIPILYVLYLSCCYLWSLII